MTPVQQRGVETVGRILEAALACFQEFGLQGFTIQRIAQRAEVSVGSLYHHFKSIDGVAAALYMQSMGDALDTLIQVLPPDGSAREGIEAVIRAYLGWSQKNAVAARFLHASAFADFMPRHAGAIQQAKASRGAILLGWVQARVASGELVQLPQSLYEMLIIGPAAETVRRWVSGAPGLDLDEAARLLPERIWRSLQAESSG